MADSKTQAKGGDVATFIDALEPAGRRADAGALCALMERVTGQPPAMWGPSIVGFGRYHYRYDSGREGDMARIGFSPRKAQLVIYLMPGASSVDALLDRLGKHSRGASCVYVRKLADVNLDVLEQLVRAGWDDMAVRYPD